MITVLMKKDAQYSLDGISPATLLAGEVYEVSQEAWDYFYAEGLAEKINPTSDEPAEVVVDVVVEKAIEVAPENKANKNKAEVK